MLYGDRSGILLPKGMENSDDNDSGTYQADNNKNERAMND